MEQQRKRERNLNFSHEENDRLVSILEKFKNVVENKRSDAITWQEKEKAWKSIEIEFNSSGTGPFRNAKNLKQKYEAMKRLTRKKCAIIRSESYKTGGGVNVAPTLSVNEDRIKGLILLSVEGNESVVHSDMIEVDESREEIKENAASFIHVDLLEAPQKDDHNYTTLSEPTLRTPGKQKLEDSVSSMPSTSKETEEEVVESPPSDWAMWKPGSLKSKKHPALCKPKEKRPFDKLAEAKYEMVLMQRRIIEEELQEKALAKEVLRQTLRHKDELHAAQLNLRKLEETKMLLEIEILRKKL